MKKLLIVILAMFVCLPAVYARRKKPKSGKIENDVFIDAKYNYRINILEEWKPILQKAKENYRLVMVQKNYEIPPNYINHVDFVLVPRMVVYIAETSKSPYEFLDSLLSGSYKSDLKNDIFKEFEILNDLAIGEGTERERVVTRKRKGVTINEHKAILWEGKVKYIKYVPLGSDPDAGVKSIHSDYQGGVAVIQFDDNHLILFHVISEGEYFHSIWADAMKVIESLKWDK